MAGVRTSIIYRETSTLIVSLKIMLSAHQHKACVYVNTESKKCINGCNGASVGGRSVLEGFFFEELWTGVGTKCISLVSFVTTMIRLPTYYVNSTAISCHVETYFNRISSFSLNENSQSYRDKGVCHGSSPHVGLSFYQSTSLKVTLKTGPSPNPLFIFYF